MHVSLELRGDCNRVHRYHYWIWALSLCQGATQVALVVRNLPANAEDVRDLGSIPGPGRFPGGGHGKPLQYSCLENPMDRGTWQATVHRVTKSQTWVKQLNTHTQTLSRTRLLKHSLYLQHQNHMGSTYRWRFQDLILDLSIQFLGVHFINSKQSMWSWYIVMSKSHKSKLKVVQETK